MKVNNTYKTAGWSKLIAPRLVPKEGSPAYEELQRITNTPKLTMDDFRTATLWLDLTHEDVASLAGLKFNSVDNLTDQVNKRVNKDLPPKTEAKIRALLQEMIKDEFIAHAARRHATLWELLAVYHKLKLATKSKSAMRLHRGSIRHYERFLGRPAMIADLTDENVVAFQGFRLDEKVSPATVNSDTCRLLALWRYAARKRMIDGEPDVEQLPEYKRVNSSYEVAEVGQLLATIAKHADDIVPKAVTKPVLSAIWWTALVRVLYFTGIRIGAAMDIRIDDYEPRRRRLLVRAENQKQKADQMFIISEITHQALMACIGERSNGLLFVWTRNKSLLWTYYHRLLKAAKLPVGRRDKFHRLRRTSATQAEITFGAGSGQRHLGHSSPEMTQQHYLDASMMPDSDMAARLPEPTTIGGEV